MIILLMGTTGAGKTTVGKLLAAKLGWTFIDGQEFSPLIDTPNHIESADGDTILNAKAGVRIGVGDNSEVAVSYGRALTGEFLYKNIIRAELRYKF